MQAVRAIRSSQPRHSGIWCRDLTKVRTVVPDNTVSGNGARLRLWVVIANEGNVSLPRGQRVTLGVYARPDGAPPGRVPGRGGGDAGRSVCQQPGGPSAVARSGRMFLCRFG